jgi:hypothetical protein
MPSCCDVFATTTTTTSFGSRIAFVPSLFRSQNTPPRC